jgi:hypothetical protein
MCQKGGDQSAAETEKGKRRTQLAAASRCERKSAACKKKGDPPARGDPSALVREREWSAENEKEKKRNDKPE